MSESNVLVIFYSRGGRTERLGVLLAEGAIQGGANIRLRRSRDVMSEDRIEADAGWREGRDRMHQEYAAPRMADVAWADVIAFGTPAGLGGVGPELGVTLAEMGLPGAALDLVSEGKAGTAFSSTYAAEGELSRRDLEGRLLRLGLVVMPVSGVGTDDYEAARAQGRRAAALGLALRSGPS